MKYLELYEGFKPKQKKSYYFGKREGPEYKGEYIYLTDDLGYAGSYATQKPATVYEFTLNFDENLIFTLTNYHHKQKLAEVVDKNVMDSIMKTKDVEMDWAALGNIGNDEYDVLHPVSGVTFPADPPFIVPEKVPVTKSPPPPRLGEAPEAAAAAADAVAAVF